MRQITIKELRRSATIQKLLEWAPCEVVGDGEVIVQIVRPSQQEVAQATDVVRQRGRFKTAFVENEFQEVAQATDSRTG